MDCVKTPQEILIVSAKSYYAYLSEHDLGLEDLKIVGATLEQERLILTLGVKVLSQDGLVLQVGERLFELSVCADMQYNQFGMGTDTISRSGTAKAG